MLAIFRWLMYSHRIVSFVLFSSVFFLVTISTSILIWTIFTMHASHSILPKIGASNFEPLDSSAINSEEDSKDDAKLEKTTAAEQMAEFDRLTEEQAADRRRESRLRAGHRMINEDEETVLGHIPIGTPANEEEEAAMIKQDTDEEETAGSESPTWQDLKDDPALQAIKKEENDDDNASTVGGVSVTESLKAYSQLTRLLLFSPPLLLAILSLDVRSGGLLLPPRQQAARRRAFVNVHHPVRCAVTWTGKSESALGI